MYRLPKQSEYIFRTYIACVCVCVCFVRCLQRPSKYRLLVNYPNLLGVLEPQPVLIGRQEITNLPSDFSGSSVWQAALNACADKHWCRSLQTFSHSDCYCACGFSYHAQIQLISHFYLKTEANRLPRNTLILELDKQTNFQNE